MEAFLTVLSWLGGMLLSLCVFTAAFLLWLIYHPQPLLKRIRGVEEENPGVLSYPQGYDALSGAVSVEKNLAYRSNYPASTYDFYISSKLPEGAAVPVVIWIHGGGFIAGVKEGVANVATLLAHDGFAVMAVNYAVAPEHRYPSAVLQLHGLLDQLEELKSRHPQVDFSQIFLAGDSAGAQIAAQLAAIETSSRLAAEMGLTQALPKGSLKGAVLTCGPFDLPALSKAKGIRMKYLVSLWGQAYFGKGWKKGAFARQSVIADWVTEDYPPTYITDGNSFSFEMQGRRLGEALRECGVPVRERYFNPGDCGEVPHEFLFLLERSDAQQVYGEIVDFLKEGEPFEN